jgi:hypothetical protein
LRAQSDDVIRDRGKIRAKSSGWDENRIFLEGDKLEVAVKNGRGC